MTEPSAEQVEAAARAIREVPSFDEGVSSELLKPWSVELARAALEAANVPVQVAELPETALEVRDGDGDLIVSGEHRKVLHQGMYVCDSCVNDLGLNVRWDRAGFMEGHPLPVEGESK